MNIFLSLALQMVHQFEKDLDKIRSRHRVELEQRIKQIQTEEKKLLRQIRNQQDSDMKHFISNQKKEYGEKKKLYKVTKHAR